jgi:hypothetical protein
LEFLTLLWVFTIPKRANVTENTLPDYMASLPAWYLISIFRDLRMRTSPLSECDKYFCCSTPGTNFNRRVADSKTVGCGYILMEKHLFCKANSSSASQESPHHLVQPECWQETTNGTCTRTLPSQALQYLQGSKLCYLKSCPYNFGTEHFVGCDSSVGIATFVLYGPEINCRWRRGFPHPSKRVLRPTQPPVQLIPDPFPRGNLAGAWLWPLYPLSGLHVLF